MSGGNFGLSGINIINCHIFLLLGFQSLDKSAHFGHLKCGDITRAHVKNDLVNLKKLVLIYKIEKKNLKTPHPPIEKQMAS